MSDELEVYFIRKDGSREPLQAVVIASPPVTEGAAPAMVGYHAPRVAPSALWGTAHWFRPSRRSKQLLALAVVCLIWLVGRHEPWSLRERVAFVPPLESRYRLNELHEKGSGLYRVSLIRDGDAVQKEAKGEKKVFNAGAAWLSSSGVHIISVQSPRTAATPTAIELRYVDDPRFIEKRLDPVAVAPSLAGAELTGADVSKDGQYLAALFESPRGSGWKYELWVFNWQQPIYHVEVYIRWRQRAVSVQFFDDGRRIVGPPPKHSMEMKDVNTAIYGVESPRPLALFTHGYGPGSFDVSKDDEYVRVSTYGSRSGVFGRTGWDCPESTVGEAAMPQTWLCAGFCAAVVLSLRSDARRAGRRAGQAAFRPGFVDLLVLLPALPIALLAIVELRLLPHEMTRDRRDVIEPFAAIVLILVSFGIATGHPLHRFVALVALGISAAGLIWQMRWILSTGLRELIFVQILGRDYAVPAWAPLMYAAVSLTFLLTALLLLARWSQRVTV